MVKKRNHYLPRGYLQGFCDEGGLLWTFDRASKEFRHLPPDSVAVEKEFYVVKDSSGRKSNVIEDWLAGAENVAIPIIRTLGAGGRRLTDEDRHALAEFIALLRLRTTVYNAEMEEVIEHYTSSIMSSLLKDEETARGTFARLAGNGTAMPNEKLDSLVAMWKAGQYTFKLNREYVIHLMVQRTSRLAGEIFAMDWGILRSSEESCFITGDLPWSILSVDPTMPIDFSFRDIFLPHVRSVVPLSKNTAVMLEATNSQDSAARFGHVAREFNRIVNRTITDNSHRFVFSSSDVLLRRLVKTTKIDQVDRPTRLYGGTEEWFKPDATVISSITISGL